MPKAIQIDGIKRKSLVFAADELPEVARFLRDGGVLAYPSESVWGIGCDASCDHALQRIFELKSRAASKGLIVLTDQASRLTGLLADELDQQWAMDRLTSISPKQMLSQARATSWVVPIKQALLPSSLTGNFASLAVRVTPHPVLSSLCQNLVHHANPFGLLVSTSCNISGEPPAANLTQAYRCFGDHIGYLDCDGLGFTQPSQIIDLMTGEILR